MRVTTILRFLPRLIAAVILFQTLYFKFTGHEDSIYIFSELGVEPWGRIGLGVFELLTGILLLTPGYFIYGALLSLGLMVGALISHFTVLGIVVRGDSGGLFALACIVFVCSVLILILHKDKLKTVPILKNMIR